MRGASAPRFVCGQVDSALPRHVVAASRLGCVVVPLRRALLQRYSDATRLLHRPCSGEHYPPQTVTTMHTIATHRDLRARLPTRGFSTRRRRRRKPPAISAKNDASYRFSRHSPRRYRRAGMHLARSHTHRNGRSSFPVPRRTRVLIQRDTHHASRKKRLTRASGLKARAAVPLLLTAAAKAIPPDPAETGPKGFRRPAGSSSGEK